MSADRAINMALRVLGIGEVERDFRRVGDAGEKSFAEVRKAANGAALEVSDYTARLKRAADVAKQMAANTPALSKGTPDQIRTNRRDFITGAIRGEQERILQGLPDTTKVIQDAAVGADALGLSLGAMTALGTAAGSALAGLGLAAKASLQAFAEHEQAIAAFNATLSLAGNRSGATGSQIRDMALQIAAATGQTEQSVLQAAASLAKVPGMTRAALQSALDAAARLADVLGSDVASVVDQQVIPVFQALAQRDMKGLYTATEELNPQLRALILTLAETGKTAEAQQALVQGLAEAAGPGPGSLTAAGNEAAASWRLLKEELGRDLAKDAEGSIHALAGLLDWLRGKIHSVSDAYQSMMNSRLAQIMQRGAINTGIATPINQDPYAGLDVERRDRPGFGRSILSPEAADAAIARFRGKYVDKAAGGSRGGRGGGRSAGDNLQREADQARAAADRITEANDAVIKSQDQRTREIEAKVGLEGAALKEVERQQEVEAAVRRINTEAIDKEVEARRKAAAAAHQQFDAAAATKAATAAVEAQQASVRDLAERYADASERQAEFTRRQQEAKAVLEGLKTPLEKINDEIDQSIDLLRHGALSSTDFEKRMDQLSHAMAKAALETDKGRQVWVGFGSDVGRTLTDMALRGGSALDLLQELIRLPLERLLYKNVEQPIAKAIDGMLGVDEDRNAEKIRAGLPSAGKVLGAYAQTDPLGGAAGTTAMQVTTLGTAADQAAAALASLTGTGGVGGMPFANDNRALSTDVAQPLDEVGASATQAGRAMQELVPLTGQFSGALGQLINQLAMGGGGGGGGLLGSVLGVVGGALGGGISARTVARLAPSAGATIAANPGLFASGTDDLPIGREFWVGENGREKMMRMPGGQVRVLSNQRAHRESGGLAMPPVILNVTVPERADPRRTASTVSRGAQAGLARAARKGLAAMGGDR